MEPDSDDKVHACPECDIASVYYRETTDDYRCSSCGSVFDEPVTRFRKKFPREDRVLKHEEDGKVYCCPNCNAAAPSTNTHPDKPDCRCKECGHRFDEPDVREPKKPGKGSKLEQLIDNGEVPDELLGSPFDDHD